MRKLLEESGAMHPGHFYDFEEKVRLVLSLLPKPAIVTAKIGRLCRLARSQTTVLNFIGSAPKCIRGGLACKLPPEDPEISTPQ